MSLPRVPFVDLTASNSSVQSEIEAAVLEVCRAGNYILDEQVSQFEATFSKSMGSTYGVGVGNGLDALRIALIALRVGPGDEVILPANTFIATALAVSSIGATPVLVDCDVRTYNIDSTRVEGAITPRTRAIIAVHLTGQAADMDALLDIGNRHALPVIEDASQAHGAFYKSQRVGSIGVCGCFSLYPTKNLGAFGDAGIVLTSDSSLYERMIQIRNYGQSEKNVHALRGLNSRLDPIQAAVLNVKFPHLDAANRMRVRNAGHYRRELEGVGDLRVQTLTPHRDHVCHLFVVETGYRDRLRSFLRSRKIETAVHYPVPIYRQAAYKDPGVSPAQFPAVEYLSPRVVSLPVYPELTQSQLSHTTESIKTFFRDVNKHG